MNLGERLKEERERLGLTQTAFAAVAGAKKHSQINWEKGAAFPNAAALEAWSAIGLDVLYVVTGQRAGGMAQSMVVNPPLPPRVRALVDNYENTNEAGKKIIEAAATAAAQSVKARRA